MAVEALDFLSNVLQGIQLHRVAIEEVDFIGSWGMDADGAPVHFYCLLQGECRLEIERLETCIILNAGDLIVVMQECDHSLRSSSGGSIAPRAQISASGEGRNERAAAFRETAVPVKLVCGSFLFKKQGENELLALLPPYIHLKGVNGKAVRWLDETLKLILRESGLNRPGKQAMVDHLAQIIFIEAIRDCLKSLPIKNSNWLMGQMDPDIGSVLELMHDQPELPWTVASLATRVCLSRSVFAARFKALLSKTPYQYLVECRMQKACTLLSEGRYGIKKIASLSGYATEAAFSNAFKRWSGKTPGAFRRIALGRSEPPDGAHDRGSHGSEKNADVR